MRRFVFFAVCFTALVVPAAVLAGGGELGFDGVVSTLEHEYNLHADKIPMMGLIRFVAYRASHAAVSNLHVAEFDAVPDTVDSDQLNHIAEQKLGPGWSRMMRETSKRNHANTVIFVRPEGKRLGMFILDADGHELDVVQLSVDPDHIAEKLAEYDHHHDRGNSQGDPE